MRTRELIAAYEAANPDDEGLLAALDDAERFLATVPGSFSCVYDSAPLPEPIDPRFLGNRLLDTIWFLLGFAQHSTAYRWRWLLTAAWRGLDDSEPLVTCLATRSLLELAAVFNRLYEELGPSMSALVALRKGTAHSADAWRALLPANNILFEHMTATRFNYDAARRRDFETLFEHPDADRPTTNILTLLDKMPQDSPRIVSWHYKYLSDFVHPNKGAHDLTIEESYQVNETAKAFNLTLHPTSKRAFDLVLSVVAYPLLVSLQSLTQQLSASQEWLTAAYVLRQALGGSSSSH